jgi:hypothetical protein
LAAGSGKGVPPSNMAATSVGHHDDVAAQLDPRTERPALDLV